MRAVDKLLEVVNKRLTCCKQPTNSQEYGMEK